ncbi:MAG: DUF4136 domain-containing protein [Desulfuromusa sp.]|jgi:hypothetical protein|nr:DUF4136 domain-containing protein [Desulfuromusa sp.]
MIFALAGCSSLHVDVSPAIDWSRVKVIEFQSPLQDPWELTQPIQSELTAMGFQVEETHSNPDLLFSYFTQESRDLTIESEVISRLKSLHVQFIDPETKTLVTAVDYFYPEVTSPSAPEMGVKEVFSGLRQQIQTEIIAQPEAAQNPPPPAAPAKQIIASPPAKIQNGQTEQLQPKSTQSENEPEDNTANISQTKPVEQEALTQEIVTPVLEKSDQKSHQAVQKTRSPWVPKFKSWGFEDWGEDSADSVDNY